MFIPLPVGRLTVTEMKQHGSQVWLASEKVLIVYTAASGDLLGFFDAHDAPISCMLSLGDEIWTASSTGEIRVWAYQNEEIVSIATLKQHTARVRSMLRFKDYVITGANDTSLFVWSTKVCSGGNAWPSLSYAFERASRVALTCFNRLAQSRAK